LFGVTLGICAFVGDPAGQAPDHGTMPPTRQAEAMGLSDSRSGYTLADLTAPAAPNQAGS
jgi:hypothetical protein